MADGWVRRRRSSAPGSAPAPGRATAAVLVFVLAAGRAEADYAYTVFDPPGSTNTNVVAMNNAGEVVGTYTTATSTHEFVRDPAGNITTFDVPGLQFSKLSNTGSGNYFIGLLLDDSGDVAGTYTNGTSFSHGFVRSPSGVITTVDVPGSQDTYITAISPGGVLAGSYQDAQGNVHDFVRSTAGVFQTFDPPGPAPITSQGFVSVSAVNDSGVAAGNAGNDDSHGFVRDAKGNITSFDVPDQFAPNPPNTLVTGINKAGVITGQYSQHSV